MTEYVTQCEVSEFPNTRNKGKNEKQGAEIILSQ